MEIDYDNPWIYEGKPFTSDMIGKYHGFCYEITNTLNGRMYIGRKVFWFRRKVKNQRNRKKSESDWKSYYGSSEEVQKDVDKYGENVFKRTILSLHETKGRLNYNETKLLFTRAVLETYMSDGTLLYYNGNINGKWFAKHLK